MPRPEKQVPGPSPEQINLILLLTLLKLSVINLIDRTATPNAKARARERPRGATTAVPGVRGQQPRQALVAEGRERTGADMYEVSGRCPVCGGQMAITRLACGTCHSALEGQFTVNGSGRSAGEGESYFGRLERLSRDQLE